jgi:hypothetical protein
MSKIRGRPINEKTMIKNGRCRFFKKGKDGFCEYYAGNRRNLESCYSKCLKRRDAE